jgi:outer membrane protein TolC
LLSDLLDSKAELARHRLQQRQLQADLARERDDLAARSGLAATEIHRLPALEGLPPAAELDPWRSHLAEHPALAAQKLRGDSKAETGEVPETLQLSVFGGYAFGEDRTRGLLEDGFQLGMRFSLPLFHFQQRVSDSRRAQAYQAAGAHLAAGGLRALEEEFDRTHQAYLLAVDQHAFLELRLQALRRLIQESRVVLEHPLPESSVTRLQLDQYQARASELESELEVARHQAWIEFCQLQYFDPSGPTETR